MRTLIRQVLVNDPELQSLGVVEEGVISGDADTPQPRPFLQLRWGPTSPGLAAIDFRSLTIWVHDEPSDYEAHIDPIIRRIKTLFASLTGTMHTYGWISQIDWDSDGEDGSDDGHGTIFRTTTHTIIGSGN